MARRRTRHVSAPKKRMEKLETVFTCPFCNNQNTVGCIVDKKHWIGIAVCSMCNERYSTRICPLSEPIDIYSEWLDECDRVNTSPVVSVV